MEVGECYKTIETAEGTVGIYSLRDLESKGIIKDLSKMPYSIKVIVESMLRQRDGATGTSPGYPPGSCCRTSPAERRSPTSRP